MIAVIGALLLAATLLSFQGPPPLDPKHWAVEDTGGLSGVFNGNVLVVSGDYDGSDTIPGTGGWNGYFLVSDRALAGTVDASVDITINAASGTEYQASLGLRDSTSNEVFWQAYFFEGTENAIGFVTKFVGATATRAVLDPTDISGGTTHTYRIVREADSRTSFYLDGILRGSQDFVGGDVRVFLHVGAHFDGTTVTVSFQDTLVTGGVSSLSEPSLIAPGVVAGIIVALFSVGLSFLAGYVKDRRSGRRKRIDVLSALLEEMKHNRVVVEQLKSGPETREIPAQVHSTMWTFFRSSDSVDFEADRRILETCGQLYRSLESVERLVQVTGIAEATAWVGPQVQRVNSSRENLAKVAPELLRDMDACEGEIRRALEATRRRFLS